MSRKKTSEIWKIDKDLLSKIVSESDSISDILKRFNLKNKGGNYKTLKNRLLHDNIDFSHIKTGVEHNIGRRFSKEPIPLEKILVENSTYNRSHLKSRLIKNNIISYICSDCGIKPLWNGKSLVLILDHINGVCDDNRLENLRFLCPNCNSQTETFAGRNRRKNSAE